MNKNDKIGMDVGGRRRRQLVAVKHEINRQREGVSVEFKAINMNFPATFPYTPPPSTYFT